MKFAIATFALLTSAVLAQDLGALPSCAKKCLSEFTTGGKIGDCDQLNAKCICSSDSFLDNIACCLADACEPDDQKKAVDFALSFCSTQGVANLPKSVTCATAASTTQTPTQSSTQAPASPSPSSGAAVGSVLGGHICGGLLAALAMMKHSIKTQGLRPRRTDPSLFHYPMALSTISDDRKPDGGSPWRPLSSNRSIHQGRADKNQAGQGPDRRKQSRSAHHVV
ncbi:hypothetical protein GGS20DRAFT_585238 [Poronia punctata]|nr:hypothetical protein GGS20DRAFT_585238 [Poronia punctata]